MARKPWEPKITHARFIVGAFSSEQMYSLANVLSDDVRLRISQGLNADDMPSKPLKPAYQKAKTKKGRNPDRDWTMSGNTLRALRTLSANENRAVIGFNNPVADRVAHWNNLRERAFAVSPRNRERLAVAVRETRKQAMIVSVHRKPE